VRHIGHLPEILACHFPLTIGQITSV